MQRIILIAAAILAAPVAHAEIYKCVVGGKTIFSQQPCAENAQVVKPKVVQPSASAVAEQQGVNESLSAASSVMERDRRLTGIARDMAAVDEDIVRIQAARRLDLRRLEASGRLAHNNLAGATWQQSLATEMQAVNARYDSELRIAESRRESLMRERERLLSATQP